MADGLSVEAERYLDHLAVERGLSEHTLAAYRRDLRRYVAFLTRRDIHEPGAVEEAVRADGVLAGGVNVYAGSVTNEGVAVAHGIEFTPLHELIDGAG